MATKKRATKQEKVHVSVILDRTGSMEGIRNDTIGGFNTFLTDQKKLKIPMTMTLVQFDSQDPYEVIHDFKDINKVNKLTRKTYVPRAMTPLLDAIGRGINDLEAKFAKLAKKDRPKKVVMAIITDGYENASREFNRPQIKKMIEAKKENDKWQFVFLSADLDSIQDAQSFGIAAGQTANFQATPQGVTNVYNMMSRSISSYYVGESASVDVEDTNDDS